MLDTIILKLDSIKERYLFLEKELSNSEIVSNHQLYATYSKEYSKIKKIVEKYEEYKTNLDNLSSTKLLLEDSDPEIKSLAQDELNIITEQLNKNEIEIKKLLIPENEDDEKDVFLEIRAGTGGDEAGLFVGDLFRMFTRVTERKKWKIELISSRESEKGGFKEIVAKISGKQVYRFLKFESGVHRVQRVPDTESQGRVHTSACSVAVLPEVEELDSIEIDKSEIRVDTFRASGAGGQHFNKTDSAVRLTHIPSGLVVECQDDRSQHKNKSKAMNLLQSKLMEQANNEQIEKQDSERKNMVGSGDRSEKIRTYNFPQNRITDHRIEFSIHSLEAFLDGDMDEMVETLIEENQARLLSKLENNL
ncbi:MAG: peptide chain release factor 1 [Pseudomonadota bacterium]|nr:peptide chain release factor 1 [Pseudomonadota bacterium]